MRPEIGRNSCTSLVPFFDGGRNSILKIQPSKCPRQHWFNKEEGRVEASAGEISIHYVCKFVIENLDKFAIKLDGFSSRFL